MENQTNPVSQPVPVPEKPRLNCWLILTILLLVVLVGSAIFYFLTHKSSPVPSSESGSQSVVLKTFELSSTNLNDSETGFYFSDTNKLYKVLLDGSRPREVVALPRNISAIVMLPNGDILIDMEVGKFVKVEPEGSSDPLHMTKPYYKQVLEEGEFEKHFWLLKNNSTTPENISSEKWNTLSGLKDNARFERVYTKELPNGQADIMVDKMDSTEPIKIGNLKQKLIELGWEGTPNLNKKHPEEFYPSFDGSYLLNKPPRGGGLGESAVVTSRDGSRVYEINFYWYVSSAIWLDNNKLLAKNQDGKQRLFIFKEDGTFKEEEIKEDFGMSFSQNNLSPSRKFLLTDADPNSGPVGTSLVDLDKRKLITVEKEDLEKLVQQYSLQDELQIDERIDHLFKFIDWNEKGDKFLYSETIAPFANYTNPEATDKLEVREIKIYDVKSGKIHTVARLYPHPGNLDEYMLQGKPVANVGQFAIR